MPSRIRNAQLGLAELIAIGVGGMIGGGIFSVLGLAVDLSGHAAPLAFLLGSLIAFSVGHCFVRLALTYPGDGSSFTYLRRAFPRRPGLAVLANRAILLGYVGTLALYAYTFGAYGADLLGAADDARVRMVLSVLVLVFFLIINLKGVRSSGLAEDLVVYSKIAILAAFAGIGLASVEPARMRPVFDHGIAAVFLAGALIFVAYEGFQLITNAVDESRDPRRDLPRGIYGSIAITSAIYVTLAVVAVGVLSPDQIRGAEEYALAAVAQPVLGKAGVVLVDLAALLATSSAINSTQFGAARMMADMAGAGAMPRPLARRAHNGVPWAATLAMTAGGVAFTLLGGLATIAAFASMTFLWVFLGVAVAALRLRRETGSHAGIVWAGIALMLATVGLLAAYLWRHQPDTLLAIGILYAGLALLGLRRPRASTKYY